MNSKLKEFHEHLKKSKRIVALLGAGLSASSGLPVFRGSQGLWKNFNMIDLATPDAFHYDPGLVWQFYSHRRYTALQAKPNTAHYALASLSKVPGIDLLAITQNVDGLLARAGQDDKQLYEIHGSLFDLKCTGFFCNYVERNNFKHPLTEALAGTEQEFIGKRKRKLDEAEVDQLEPQVIPVKELSEKDLPQCPVCSDGTLMRPGVVWFGESLSPTLLDKIDTFIELPLGVDLILVIGTSGTVYPANSYVDRVRMKGGTVAIFNTDINQDVLDDKVKDTWGFLGDAAETLPLALEPLLARLNNNKV